MQVFAGVHASSNDLRMHAEAHAIHYDESHEKRHTEMAMSGSVIVIATVQSTELLMLGQAKRTNNMKRRESPWR